MLPLACPGLSLPMDSFDTVRDVWVTPSFNAHYYSFYIAGLYGLSKEMRLRFRGGRKDRLPDFGPNYLTFRIGGASGLKV